MRKGKKLILTCLKERPCLSRRWSCFNFVFSDVYCSLNNTCLSTRVHTPPCSIFVINQAGIVEQQYVIPLRLVSNYCRRRNRLHRRFFLMLLVAFKLSKNFKCMDKGIEARGFDILTEAPEISLHLKINK